MGYKGRLKLAAREYVILLFSGIIT